MSCSGRLLRVDPLLLLSDDLSLRRLNDRLLLHHRVVVLEVLLSGGRLALSMGKLVLEGVDLQLLRGDENLHLHRMAIPPLAYDGPGTGAERGRSSWRAQRPLRWRPSPPCGCAYSGRAKGRTKREPKSTLKEVQN